MKRIIITGATGNIGQSIAHYLAGKQYDLILSSYTEEKLQSLKRSIQKISAHTVDYQRIDFNDVSSIIKYTSWLDSLDHTIDGIILITPRPDSISAVFPESDQWRKLFQGSFIGPMEWIKQLIPYLNKGSKIVIISGITSVQYMDGYSAYGVLRAMWLSQAKSLSYELGPKEVYVNTISPGGILTEYGISKIKEKAKAKGKSFAEQYRESTQNVPLRKYAKPEEIAKVVEFFLTDQSSHVTGVNLMCDGGFTRAY